MAHGARQPHSPRMLTGSGSMEFLARSLDMLRRLLLDYKTWVFVPSAPRDALLLTIGQALDPLEYAIIETAESRMENEIKNNRYDPSIPGWPQTSYTTSGLASCGGYTGHPRWPRLTSFTPTPTAHTRPR